VEIEHISGIGLTSRRTTQKEGHLTISDGLLGKILVDDEGMFAVITEILTNSATRIGGQILDWGGFGGGSGNHDGVFHGTLVSENLHEIGDG